MIIVTEANGITGRAIIQTLLSNWEEVRALVHKAEQINELKSLGTMEVISGDMLNQETMNEAYKGINTVYHSLLHPVLQDMPHHQKKLMVEEQLVN